MNPCKAPSHHQMWWKKDSGDEKREKQPSKGNAMGNTVVSLLKDTLRKGHPSIKDTNFWHQVLWMHVVLPLTKGHLSNKDNFLAEGVSLLEVGCGTAKPEYKGYNREQGNNSLIQVVFIYRWFLGQVQLQSCKNMSRPEFSVAEITKMKWSVLRPFLYIWWLAAFGPLYYHCGTELPCAPGRRNTAAQGPRHDWPLRRSFRPPHLTRTLHGCPSSPDLRHPGGKMSEILLLFLMVLIII